MPWTHDEEEVLLQYITKAPDRWRQKLETTATNIARSMNVYFPTRKPPFTKDSILSKFKRRPWTESLPHPTNTTARSVTSAARAAARAAKSKAIFP